MLQASLRRSLSGLFGLAETVASISAPDPITEDPCGNATFAWQSGEALMAEHNRTVTMRCIDRHAGLPPAHFERLYQDIVIRFADYVQQMPASEAHHHARLGGLLDHSLDVAERALRIRQAYLLPPNRASEVVAREADRWTYAVFLAALFHDIGKPAMDLEVSLYQDDGRSLGVWAAAAGPMQAVDRYHIGFRPDRRYHDHERIAPFLARSMLPDMALGWLGGDQDLMSVWLATLAGDDDHAGTLGSILVEADRQSVAADLGNGSTTPVASARKRPLSDMLLMAIRQLLDDGRLRINRPGAEAWVTATDLWLVSKASMDLVREWLIGEGLTSVPSNNNRLMDELQQHRLCSVTQKDRAVWSTRVVAGDFDQVLTMLRFPIETIWPDPDRRPAQLDGEIVTDQDEETAGIDMGAGATEQAGDTPSDSSASDPNACPRESDIAGEFLTWLSKSIEGGDLAVNARDGWLWMVDEGLFLRRPKILQTFAEHHDVERTDVEQALQSRGSLLMNTRPTRTSVVHYELTLDVQRSETMKGHVVIDPEDVLGVELPGVCEHIERVPSREGYW